MLLLFLEYCSSALAAVEMLPASKPEPDVITVSAAASLTEAFTDIASHFEEENPGTDVNLNFARFREPAYADRRRSSYRCFCLS